MPCYYTILCQTPEKSYRVGQLFTSKEKASLALRKLYMKKQLDCGNKSHMVYFYLDKNLFGIFNKIQKRAIAYTISKVKSNPVFLYQENGNLDIVHI